MADFWEGGLVGMYVGKIFLKDFTGKDSLGWWNGCNDPVNEKNTLQHEIHE